MMPDSARRGRHGPPCFSARSSARLPARLFGAALLAIVVATPAAAGTGRWVPAWLAPPIAYEPQIKDALPRPFANETARQELQAAVAGAEIRVRFTNELGDKALTIGAASIVRLDDAGKPVAASLAPLRFHGQPDAAIPPHAPLLSDPLPFAVRAGERLAIAIYYPEQAAPPAHAQMIDLVPGDATGAALWTNAQRVRAAGVASGLAVSGANDDSGKRVLVAFGDSITEGAGSTRAMSWPDQLGRMLGAEPGGRCWVVANAGISGNRLLHDGRGPNALARFDRDVLAVPGIAYVVLLEGINDIGTVRDPAVEKQPTADELIAAYEQLLARAEDRGVRVLFGTLLPYEGAAYASAAGEQRRQKLNAWIRANRARFAGVIDFDSAMQEPGNPAVMRLAEQIGDHLHPNDAGYTRMARTALPVVLGQGCR